MTNIMEERLAVQEVQGSHFWHLHVEAVREDSIWLGTAVACCDTESVPVLRAMRYGPTAEDAKNAAIETLREAITAAEGRSVKEKELQ